MNEPRNSWMSDLSEYLQMHREGASLEEVYTKAKADGLSGYMLVALLRDCGLNGLIAQHWVMADGLHPHPVLRRLPSDPVERLPEYKRLFEAVVETHLRLLEFNNDIEVPRKNVRVAAEGFGFHDAIMPVDVLCDILYLGDHRYYEEIHLFPRQLKESYTVIWVVERSFNTVPTLEETRNIPPHTGPFAMLNVGYNDQIIEETLREFGIIE